MINVPIDFVHNSSRICIRNKDMIWYIGKYVYFVSMLKYSILYYRKYEISSTFLFEIQNIIYMKCPILIFILISKNIEDIKNVSNKNYHLCKMSLNKSEKLNVEYFDVNRNLYF